MAHATLVNVIGLSRAGTTMLDVMLGNSDEAFSCGEAYAWFRPWRSHNTELNCPCKANPCPVWKGLAHVPENSFHTEVIRQQGVRYVIDSAKDLNWYLDAVEWARKGGLSVRTIAIWKDPVNQAYSYWKRTGSSRLWRSDFLTYYRRLLRLGLPFVSVKHEDLTNDTEAVLRRVCEVIEIPYFPGKERFWEKTHHHLFGSLGTRIQCQSGQSEIRSGVTYEAGFIEEIERIQSALAADRDVKSIIDELVTRDVGNTPADIADRWEYLHPIRRPAWYWARASKRLFRRFFPEPGEAHHR